jgi:hypothetical protein
VEKQVEEGEITPTMAAQKLLNAFFATFKQKQ